MNRTSAIHNVCNVTFDHAIFDNVSYTLARDNHPEIAVWDDVANRSALAHSLAGPLLGGSKQQKLVSQT